MNILGCYQSSKPIHGNEMSQISTQFFFLTALTEDEIFFLGALYKRRHVMKESFVILDSKSIFIFLIDDDNINHEMEELGWDL